MRIHNNENYDDEYEESPNESSKFFEGEESGNSNISNSRLLLKPTKKAKIGFSSSTGKAWIDSIKEVRKTIVSLFDY
jgi:hypothetical protein